MANIKNIFLLLQKCIACKRDILLINFTSLGCWTLLIYPLKFIEPAIVAAICIGISPLVTVLAGKILYKKQTIDVKDYLITFLLGVIVLYLGALCLSNHNAVKVSYNFWQMIIAVICAIVGGIVLGFNTLYTKRLSVSRFSPLDILAVRFILLIIVMGFLQIFTRTYASLSFATVRDILVLSLSLIIIPQVLFQNSINRIEPVSLAIISTLMPVLTFFLEFADQRLKPNGWTIIGVLLIFLIGSIGAVMRYNTEK